MTTSKFKNYRRSYAPYSQRYPCDLSSSRSSKYITTPNTDVNTPAACFIFSKVIFVPNTLLALMLCRFNQDSKLSFGNFSFCKTADMTFGLFNSNILCCSHIYVIYWKIVIDMLKLIKVVEKIKVKTHFRQRAGRD